MLTGFDVQNLLVNGAAGVVTRDESAQLFSLMGFTVRDAKIVEIDVLAGPERLRRLDLTALDWRGA